jgi:hypothetical protein
MGLIAPVPASRSLQTPSITTVKLRRLKPELQLIRVIRDHSVDPFGCRQRPRRVSPVAAWFLKRTLVQIFKATLLEVHVDAIIG